MNPVDLIVRRHKRPRVGIPDGDLEREDVYFAEGSLRDEAVDSHPLVLLIVRDKVFDRGHDSCFLNAVHDGCSAFSRENRVLGERFECSPSQWTSLHIDRWPKKRVSTLRLGLCAHQSTSALQQIDVPCGGEAGTARETGGRDAVEEAGAADAIGAIGESDGGDIESRDGLGVPKVDS